MSIDVRGRYIFLSGPMTGLPHYNIAAFVEAHDTLKTMGAAQVYDPAISYLCPPYWMGNDTTHENYMLECLDELTHKDAKTLSVPFYDMLVQLPGWQDSAGASLEFEVAKACGIEVHELAEVVDE